MVAAPAAQTFTFAFSYIEKSPYYFNHGQRPLIAHSGDLVARILVKGEEKTRPRVVVHTAGSDFVTAGNHCWSWRKGWWTWEPGCLLGTCQGTGRWWAVEADPYTDVIVQYVVTSGCAKVHGCKGKILAVPDVPSWLHADYATRHPCADSIDAVAVLACKAERCIDDTVPETFDQGDLYTGVQWRDEPYKRLYIHEHAHVALSPALSDAVGAGAIGDYDEDTDTHRVPLGPLYPWRFTDGALSWREYTPEPKCAKATVIAERLAPHMFLGVTFA